jgi:hypothetical protein
MWSVPRRCKKWVEWSEWVRVLLRLSPRELLLLEAGSWGTGIVRGTQSKGNVRRWKPLPGNKWWRHSRLRRLSTRCNEVQSLWISLFLLSFIHVSNVPFISWFFSVEQWCCFSRTLLTFLGSRPNSVVDELTVYLPLLLFQRGKARSNITSWPLTCI